MTSSTSLRIFLLAYASIYFLNFIKYNKFPIVKKRQNFELHLSFI